VPTPPTTRAASANPAPAQSTRGGAESQPSGDSKSAESKSSDAKKDATLAGSDAASRKPEERAAEGAGVPAVGAQTPEERRQGLDRQLDASLTAFDAMLLKEQQAAAEKRAQEVESDQGPGSGGGGGGGGGAGGASGTRGGQSGGARDDRASDGEAEPRDRGAERTRDRSTGSSRGGSRAEGGRGASTEPEPAPSTGSNDDNAPPPDVGDGRDDEVVARQIREAAMKEKDPAIREKLWDEYRRYKGLKNVRG
jgi:hypothetical protein